MSIEGRPAVMMDLAEGGNDAHSAQTVRGDAGPLEAKHGLPPKVEFCRLCVLSNQRPTPSLVIKDQGEARKHTAPFVDGVCEPCRVVAQKADIDWAERERKLMALLDKFRSRNGCHDCLVPGSGGKDAVYQAHILKTKYGMHPLTVTWAPHLYTDVGWRNFTGWVHKGGFDNYLFTPDGQVHRKLTALAYRNMLHPFQPFIFGQRHYPLRMARLLGIPVVFYGECHADYGGHKGEDQEQRRFIGEPEDDIFISGLPIDALEAHGIAPQQLSPYLPMSTGEVRAAGIEVHYLGTFLPWAPQHNYAYAVEHAGFEANSERTEGTYTRYNAIDDKLDGFHYWCGYIKFGIGRCTHEASREIRRGHITRAEGVALVRRFDGEFPARYFPEMLAYMNMERDEFLALADSFRSPHLWRQTGAGYELRHVVS
jgi:N-acetyl sugar amidotransferase